MPWLQDEPVEPWEDPADRKSKQREAPYPEQVIRRHAWEDGKRKALENRGFALLARMSAPGTHFLNADNFALLARTLYWEQPALERATIASGVIELRSSVVRLRPATRSEHAA